MYSIVDTLYCGYYCSSFVLDYQTYSVGDCVYLLPDTYTFPVKKNTTVSKKQPKKDEPVNGIITNDC